MTLPEEIKIARGRRGLSQIDAARAIGIAPRTLARIERGESVHAESIAKAATWASNNEATPAVAGFEVLRAWLRDLVAIVDGVGGCATNEHDAARWPELRADILRAIGGEQ